MDSLYMKLVRVGGNRLLPSSAVSHSLCSREALEGAKSDWEHKWFRDSIPRPRPMQLVLGAPWLLPVGGLFS